MKQRPGSDSDRSGMVTQGYTTPVSLSDGPLSSQPIQSHDAHYHDQAQFESDKRAVYKYANHFKICHLAIIFFNVIFQAPSISTPGFTV